MQNGAVINRVVKLEDKYSKIYSISDFTKYETLIKAANWQQPYLLDEVAKEIFFSEDNLLFLEGQEDVGLLKRENAIPNANIFGYGVRGKNNFQFSLQLAKDSGYRKVACILDAGEDELKIKNDLTTTFSDYKIIQWNKNDIRDKRAYESKEKTGYFDEKGRKKDKAQLDDFEEKILSISQYFD